MIGSRLTVISQQFERRADYRAEEPRTLTDLMNLLPQGGIGKVPAIPSQQKLNLMDGRHADMKCVDSGFLRQRNTLNQLPPETQRIIGNIKQRQPLQHCQPLARCFRIPGASLLQNEI